MLHPDTLDCPAAREQLSARLDGELADEGALLRHLARCAGCAEHERALGTLALDFADLRRDEPVADVWPAIERGARRKRVTLTLARVAAAFVGFVGLGAAGLALERAAEPPPSGRHLLERLAPDSGGPDALLAALPEYRLLRALPREGTR